ncbi:putative F-box protein At1g49610 [Coffea arabica]|uniref:F-box protein At1g49610 n=1 Tax=Coffea arabica TaxID=13443 RepID=A0ABM4X0B8_COFAR
MVKRSGSSGRRSPSSPLRASHGDGRKSVSYSPSRSFYGSASDLERVSGRRYSSYSRSRASHSEGGNSVSCSRSPSSHGNGSNSERARVSGREKSPGTHGDGRNSKRVRVSKSDKCTETSGNDRISALPNKILVHILSFLTMDEAVATGILSKRWEYLWTEIPNLVYIKMDEKKNEYYPEGFLKFIGETLQFHTCTRIKNFMVKFFYRDRYIDYFDTWVGFALKNRAEELSLISVLEGSRYTRAMFYRLYTLRRKLCTNSVLTKLELSLCTFAPNSLISWKSLKSLSLGCVKLQESILQTIQLGSPRLEYLELKHFTGLETINITSQSVKKLVLRDYHVNEYYGDFHNPALKVSCPNVCSLEVLGCLETILQLTDTTFQVEANLDFNLREIGSVTYENCQKMVQSLLESLGSVEKLSIGSWFLQVLSTMEKGNLLCPSSPCKSLTLNVSRSIEREDLYGIVCILESLPNLEVLTLVMSSADRPKFLNQSIRDNFPKLNGSLNCLQQHLKTVRVINFVQKAHETEFLEYLLENAEKLEKMTIEVSNSVQMLESFQLTKKLLSFPRASTRAMILFSEGP